MSLKPIAPQNHRPGRAARPAPMPVVVVPARKQSGGSGLLMLILLVALLGGGYFVYNNQQKNAEAIAARDARAEAVRQKAEEERQRLEAEHQSSHSPLSESDQVTAMGSREKAATITSSNTASPSVSTRSASTSSSASSSSSAFSDTESTPEDEGEVSALGSTSAPKSGTGEYAVKDTTPPPFDLKAEGSAAKKVSQDLRDAIDKASKGDTFHDLQADLKRSFEVAYPDLFADESTLPPFPDKEQKTLRLAQGIYVCLNITSELQARNEMSEAKHTRFVNWLLSDKAKAARTFTYGLEHCGVSDMETATELMDKLRKAYVKGPADAMNKIPTILKKATR